MKKRLKILGAVLAAVCALGTWPGTASAEESGLSVSAQSAVLMTGDNCTVLYEKNPEERLSMASTTKIMTALLTLEEAQAQDRQVKITEEMVRVEGSSMGLKAGNIITLTGLAQGMLLCSGNDAANAAAIAIAGSQEEFAKRMNERARQIGMKNTNFVTPSGLDDDNHYTTAYDMALLGACAMENQKFREIVSQKSMQVQFIEPDQKYTFGNHNRLLTSYEGCIGIKTGFTKKSGRCLVSCAEREGVRLIAVTLNAPDDWNDHERMLDYGFSKTKQALFDDTALGLQVPVAGGEQNTVTANAAFTAEASVLAEQEAMIEKELEVPRFLYAPVRKGQTVGKLTYEIEGRVLASVDLVAGEEVSVRVIEKSLWERFLDWFS